MTTDDHSPICLAITKRAKDVVDLLITCRVALDQSVAEYLINDEKYKFSELENQLKILDSEMHKVERESASFIERIASKGLDIDGKNSWGSSALDSAIDYNLLHILPVLLKYTKKIEYVDEKNGKRTLLHLFLERNTFMRNCHRTRRTKNWYSNYTQRYAKNIVRVLLDKGLSPDIPDKHGDTALHVAIEQKENLDIIEMLLERSTNVNQKNSKGKTPFDKAIWEWKLSNNEENEYFVKILRALIEKGAADEYEGNLLFHVAEKQILSAVEFFKENGADFSATTGSGETLMHLLVKGSSNLKFDKDVEIKLFDNFISNGCEANAKDKNGMTPLYMAADKGNVTIVRKLLEHGLDVDCRNDQMQTPLLYLAIHSKKTDMAKLLLEYGANVNARDVDGFTALHATAVGIETHENVKMLQFLLKHGADFNARTNAGHSVLRMGLWHNYNRYGRKKKKVEPGNLPKITACIKYDVSCVVVVLLKYYIKYNVVMNIAEDEYKDLIEDEIWKDINEKCLQELKELKSTSINSSTTLYNYLRMGPDGWRAYVKSEGLQKILHSTEFKTQFFEYSNMIWASYHEGVRRRALLEPAKKTWLELTEIGLPEVCLELIFSFLSNSELFDFIEK